MLFVVFSSVAFALFTLETSASTHWIVTERGRIQAKDDTMFDMKNPDDLVGFMELEKKLMSIENLTRLIATKSKYVEETNKYYNTYSKLSQATMQPLECKSAIPIEDCNFYISSTLAGNDYNTILTGNVENGDDFPECAPLNFSMKFYEHLLAMQDRSLLKMSPEKTLFPLSSIDCIGHQVAAHLQVNQSSWELYNLATLFWRAKGDAQQAINCIRHSLFHSPANNKHIGLLHLGNVFHQSKRSAEAAIILHAAIDHSSYDPESHWTLGNIYSVIGDYQKAIVCYENALKLDKSLSLVQRNLHSVKCHASISQALTEAMDRLQELLNDIEDASLLKQEKTHIEGLINKYRAITNIAEKNLGTEVGTRILELDDRLKNLMEMVQTLSDNMDFEKRVETKPNPLDGECLSTEDIEYSILHSSFEDRIYSCLNEDLGLKSGENHPLPWHPPVCEEDFRKKFPQVPNHVMNQFFSPGKANKLKAQPVLMKHLRQFVNGELEADEELGQRIYSALEKDLCSRYLLRSFAGLYWFARGELRLATKCFLASLLESPEEDAVVPLTAMSSMLMSMGLSDGAIYLALRGIESNMSDVGGNMLLSSLYLQRGDLKNAKLHLQQAFLNRPRGLLRSIAHNLECHIRILYHEKEFCESEIASDDDELMSMPNLKQCIKLTKNK
ncbi:tetratricopeptide repeat protein 17 [Neocloeon triangulifer]|uniref:tetratricopeptide repeat protein 17 n=1 Tax=Neocloeon triangulifer TaxID=2078957 RepID=UPI00286EDAD4|nr:tetratricopeptide repeat protein 17 [Neocloeon triangulifer]